MFRGRRQLQRRDRESGLAFNWRVPVSSTGSFMVALLLITFVAVGLATMVRVSIAPAKRGEPEQGTLVIVPGSASGGALTLRAIEAGPFPSRWNPAADPKYVALRREALKAAMDVGVPYEPVLREVEWMHETAGETPLSTAGVLPPLPGAGEAAEVPEEREVMVSARVLGPEGVKGFTHAALPIKAGAAVPAVGGRYLLEHDAEGRVLDVIGLAPERREGVVVQWLSRGLVTGHGGKPGWLSVETVVGR